jgi:hypothetical protein
MRTGRCLCGAVAFELTAEPQMLAFCHCRDCQYISGGEPAAVAVAPAGTFRVTQGELKAYRSKAQSGAMADRHFCAACGTHVVSRLDGGPFLAVKVGTLDDVPPLQPQMELWTASAQPWAHRPDVALSFEQNPPG